MLSWKVFIQRCCAKIVKIQCKVPVGKLKAKYLDIFKDVHSADILGLRSRRVHALLFRAPGVFFLSETKCLDFQKGKEVCHFAFGHYCIYFQMFHHLARKKVLLVLDQ